MIQLKTDQELKIMEKGGRILNTVMEILLQNVKAGVKLSELDSLAENKIRSFGAKPSFQEVPDYDWTICACVNDVVVHGIPDDYEIKNGDVVGIDCGVYYEGFHTDASWTVHVRPGKSDRNEKIEKFLSCGEKALIEAINQVKISNRIFDVSQSITSNIESAGYSVVRSLVGHGIGRDLHEEPEIPGKVKSKRLDTPEITQGMALAVEVIYNMGSHHIKYRKNDKWTIYTEDGKISGLFEATVAVTSHGVILLTKNYGTSGNN